MSTVTHKGRFTNQAGDIYEFHIDVDTDEEIEPIDLVFDATEASIEWKEAALHDALHGSAVTLHVVSPEDRSLTHLYTVDPARVRLTIYRNGNVFWRGCIDSEQYEEPYQYRRDYPVMLTFSDLEPLDHIDFDLLPGRTHTIDYLLKYCLGLLGYGNSYTTAITMHDAEGVALTPTKIAVDDSNFYDEDGEPMSLREVLEAVLQPLGLHLIQRAGEFVLFDLITLYRRTPEAVRWERDEQTFSVGPTYSEIRITQSPYGDATAVDGSLTASDVKFDGDSRSQSYTAPGHTGKIYDGFNIEFGPRITKPGALTIGNALVSSTGVLNFYRIDAIYSGSDDAGIASVIKAGSSRFGSLVFGGHCPNPRYSGAVTSQGIGHFFAVTPITLGGYDGRYQIKVTLDMLLDTRYNPFEEGDKYNGDLYYKMQSSRWNFVYIPCRIYVTDDEGSVLMYYTNENVVTSPGTLPASLKGVWTSANSGIAPWGECWLAFYDWEDRKKKTGCNGWATNRQAIPRYTDALPGWWSKRGDGEFIPIPPVGGRCTLHVEFGRGATPISHEGLIWYDFGYDFGLVHGEPEEVEDIPAVRWQLFRNPKVEIVDNNGLAAETGDLVYSCPITPGAHDKLELDTMCGSDTYTLPTARGLYRRNDGIPISQRKISNFVDSEHIVSLEGALISILASQYEQRSTVLTGAAEPSERACPVYTVNTEPADARFMATAERLDLIEGVSTLTLTRIFSTRFHTVTEE